MIADSSTAHQKALLMKRFESDDPFVKKYGIHVIYQRNSFPNTVQRYAFVKLRDGKFYIYVSKKYCNVQQNAVEVFANGTGPSFLKGHDKYQLKWWPEEGVRRRTKDGRYYTKRRHKLSTSESIVDTEY